MDDRKIAMLSVYDVWHARKVAWKIRADSEAEELEKFMLEIEDELFDLRKDFETLNEGGE